MKQFLNRLMRNTQGNALMLFAAALIPITLMIGSGIDASITYMTRSKLQNACDAGALAGRLAMVGTNWDSVSEAEARKFFDFNFPAGTNGVTDARFDIAPDVSDPSQLVGSARGTVPTSLMFIFGYDTMDIAVRCDAKRDMGHNDVMLVLDVTSSMLSLPSSGGAQPKIDLLRSGVMGLYRALDDADSGSITRYGFVPFSQTVNVARQLDNNDIIRNQYFVDLNQQVCDKKGNCTTIPISKKLVGAKDSTWNNGQNGTPTDNAIIQGFRTSGNGCIEERPSFGTPYNNGVFTIKSTVSLDDINLAPRNSTDTDRQFGRYEPLRQEGYVWDACVSEAKQFASYDTEGAFQTAVNETTARVTGGTYSDIGMLWGVRFSSRDGLLKANNPKQVDSIPVNVHLIFFTDGQIYGSADHYSAYGVERYENRLTGDGTFHNGYQPWQTVTGKHRERFKSICSLAKSMGMTVWVVSLDTLYDQDFVNCATSPKHFHESDGTDLEAIFTSIGQGIGNLRLTR